MSGPLTEVDLVMQGGVSSGVVYPGALTELGRAFRFRRIGGTSAGAIAASLLAAAEYRRQVLTARQAQGEAVDLQEPFGHLTALGRRLGAPLNPADSDGPRVLEGLFEPDTETAPLYRVGRAALAADWDGAARHGVTWLAGVPGFEEAAGHVLDSRLSALLPAWPAWLTPLLGPARPARPLAARAAVWLGLGALGFVGVVVSAFLLARLLLPEAASLVLALVLPLALLAWGVRRAALRVQRRAGRVLGTLGPAVRRVAPQLLGTLTRNNFGLSSGWGGGQFTHLTPFMHREIQALAGEPGGILTFGHLRTQDIELKLITSCLSRRRPYVLPLDQRSDDVRNLYFRPSEWLGFFPSEVVAHLVRHSERAYVDQGVAEPGSWDAWTYYRLPPEESLPVLVAMRLSMSFPVLFTTVPLYYVKVGNAGNPQYRECRSARRTATGLTVSTRPVRVSKLVFSDGGLTSNFPLMLFDDPVSPRPLLALNLQYRPEDQEAFLAGEHPWVPFNTPIESFPSFASGLLATAQQWFDQSMLALPGYGERMVSITLPDGTGGLNLGMDRAKIEFLIRKGAQAGQKLRDRFEHGSTDPFGAAALEADHWRNVTPDLGELLEAYVAAYDPEDVATRLAAMPRDAHGRQRRPNAGTLNDLEREALEALSAAASAVRCARQSRMNDRDALFAHPTGWNQPSLREVRGLLRYRPFL